MFVFRSFAAGPLQSAGKGGGMSRVFEVLGGCQNRKLVRSFQRPADGESDHGQAMSPPARPSTVAAAVHRRSNGKAVVPLRTSPLIDDHLASHSTPGPSPEEAWREAMRQERTNRDHCYYSDAGPSSNVPSDSPEERWRNRMPSDSPEERWRKGMQEEKQARLIAAEWQRTSAFSRG